MFNHVPYSLFYIAHAAESRTTHLKKVSISGNGQEIIVSLLADGRIDKYKDFLLSNPDRVVVDLYDVEVQSPRRYFHVDNPLLRSVRLGVHPEKTRVVLDMNSSFYDYRLSPWKDGMRIFVAEQKAEINEEEEKVLAEAQQKLEEAFPEFRGEKVYTGQKISLDFQDAEIRHILRLIADVSGLNIIAGDDVVGKITLTLRDVPWDQALDIVLKSKDLGMVRVGNVIRVAPMEKLRREEEALLAIKRTKEIAEEPILEAIPVNFAAGEELLPKVRDLLSERGSVSFDVRTKQLIVKDLQKNVESIKELVAQLDRETPQVLIEARLVEARTNFLEEFGVELGFQASDLVRGGEGAFGVFGASEGEGRGAGSPLAVNLPAAVGRGEGGAIGFAFSKLNGTFDLDLRLSALESAGKIKIISRPKITTLDNREAIIVQGSRIPYQVEAADAGLQIQLVDANLQLRVRPKVTADGKKIIMVISVAKNEPDFGHTVLGQPTINTNEATTEVLLRDGQTTVIGGVFATTTSEENKGVPFLSHIPLLKFLFSKKRNATEKRELIIFITPTIVKRSI